MKLQLIAIGNKMPLWVKTACAHYLKKFPKNMPFELIEIPAEKRGKKADIKQILSKEGEAMMASVNKNNYIVTLDVMGKSWGSDELAKKLLNWQKERRDLSFLVGGPEGLSPFCRSVSHESWSLSRLTLPHPLVRILVAESIYRAWSMLTQHPYHRA